MPVTVYPASHEANEINITQNKWDQPSSSSLELLTEACGQIEGLKVKELIQSSFQATDFESHIFAENNGFIGTCTTAYNRHNRLVLRPDDVWIAILSQFNIYVNKNAETLRDVFVSHEGKRELVIEESGCDPKGDPKFGVNWGQFSYKMSKLLGENMKDPSLRDWILPQFSTTLKKDQAIASILFMSTMQQWFSYGCMIKCGLPSVTLAGDQKDWENLALKAEKLQEFGKECKEWLSLLRPVLKRFVKTFEGDTKATKDFWQKIVHYTGGGSGPTYLSGWITAFCFWKQDGASCYTSQSILSRWGSEALKLDGAVYHRIDTTDIPAGWASVPLKIMCNGLEFKSTMIAGSIGYRVSNSGIPLAGKSTSGFDTLDVENGWWIYETAEKENGVDTS